MYRQPIRYQYNVLLRCIIYYLNLLGLLLLPVVALLVLAFIVLGLLLGGDVTGADVYFLSFPGLLSRRTCSSTAFLFVFITKDSFFAPVWFFLLIFVAVPWDAAAFEITEPARLYLPAAAFARCILILYSRFTLFSGVFANFSFFSLIVSSKYVLCLFTRSTKSSFQMCVRCLLISFLSFNSSCLSLKNFHSWKSVTPKLLSSHGYSVSA